MEIPDRGLFTITPGAAVSSHQLAEWGKIDVSSGPVELHTAL